LAVKTLHKSLTTTAFSSTRFEKFVIKAWPLDKIWHLWGTLLSRSQWGWYV